MRFIPLIYIVLAGLMLVPGEAAAQSEAAIQKDSTATAPLTYRRKKKDEPVVPLTFKERLALKVNTIDWALALANFGFEYDLSASPYNRYTLGANIRYNGGASVPFHPRFDLKYLDARAELRRYWHQGLTMKEGQKRKPKYWRAYYWGVYAGYTDYTAYFSKGYTGENINLGGSFGYEVALLSFRHGFLDLDLGISAGMMFGHHEKSEMQGDERVTTETKDWHVVPYPMISEIRVGLVYRFKTVRDKYVKSKH